MMPARRIAIVAAAAVAFTAVGACHKKPETAPAPTAADSAAMAQARADSIARAQAAAEAAARADSIAREKARQDSIAAAAAAAAAEQTNLHNAVTATVYFDFDASTLKPDAQATLDAKLPVLQANPSVRIRIEGNADERGSDEYNLALGMRRATAAKRYLTSKGIDAGRIDVISNGEEKGVCTDHDESCWQQNRRDEFVIVAGGDNLMKPSM